MDRTLMLLLFLLCNSDLQAEEKYDLKESSRLVEGSGRCAGTLELKHEGQWRRVNRGDNHWSRRPAAPVCAALDCGPLVSVEYENASYEKHYVWNVKPDCFQFGSAMKECVSPGISIEGLYVTCLDSVRLVNGSSLCSGRLQVRSDHTWSSVCEADFDQQDAEVVCRELGCGPPSVLQGALYGEEEAPVWTKEFQCGGHESALLDCWSSGSDRTSCSPGRAVGLTCSEPVRLVGGASRCNGTVEMKYQGEWRPVSEFYWTQKDAALICGELDCGSVVLTETKYYYGTPKWWLMSYCVKYGSVLRDCLSPSENPKILSVTCSDFVRLVNGSSLCSGRLQVRSDHTWSSVCEADFDQQDAEVVCREIGCGPPLVLRGALYGEEEAPVWTKEFQCGGHESALLDCGSSDSDRTSCSPGRAVGLTCSEPDDFRLVGGASPCEGSLEVKHLGEWRSVADIDHDWTMKEAAVICRQLDCGSAVSVQYDLVSGTNTWKITPACVHSGSAIRDCTRYLYSHHGVRLNCSEPPAQPDRSTEEKPRPRVSVFTPVFIFTLVLLVLSLTFFIVALRFSCKSSRQQPAEQQMDTELKTHQQT